MAVKRFYFFGSYSSGPRPFIMEVESDSNGEFTIPTAGGGYNYDVKTSDGQAFSGVTGDLTITFPSPNTRYDVEITGDFPRIYFNNGSERLKILDIKQWGDIEWGANQSNAFYGCANLQVSATDVPDLSNATNMSHMFRDCTSLITLDVSAWDVSNVTDMSNMFLQCTSLTSLDVSAWDVSSVTDMSIMFYNCTSFIVDVDFINSNNITSLQSFANGVHTIHNVKLDCTSVANTGGSVGIFQPFGPLNDSSNANIELHNLSVDIRFNNNRAAANLTSGVTFYNMILTFDHSASAIITMHTIQKNNLLSYLQANVDPSYITLQDWLTDIGSNWTIA